MLKKQALLDGYSVIIDGTNASDKPGDRPGMRALTELSVHSPLRECGFIKDDIRRLSKEVGLFTWNKPAYSCLAARIPAGNPIDERLLNSIESAEKILFRMGFTDFRARVCENDMNAVLLQFTEEQLDKAVENQAAIVERIKLYFDAVLLDPVGR
jgi:uncharacterized protein